MSRHYTTSEAYQMEHLRSSPSQQHLNPSRSSSISQRDDSDQEQNQPSAPMNERRPHKLDLYSIPVFLLEVVVLLGLSYSAYYIHFQHHHAPLVTGFYCDDISLRQHFQESKFVQQFTQQDNELVVIALLLALPIALIIFCELVNSMFGALKFRQIRALCTCCKLHSITRRTIRFTGAYILGFMIVLISCDILANTSGRLRPYFAQECPRPWLDYCSLTSNDNARSTDGVISNSNSNRLEALLAPSAQALQMADEQANNQLITNSTNNSNNISLDPSITNIHPLSPPISSSGGTNISSITPITTNNDYTSNGGNVDGGGGGGSGAGSQESSRYKRDNVDRRLIERKWIDLSGSNLTELCNFPNYYSVSQASRKYDQIAMSWPSFPAAIVTYSILFISCYLCFVGTARPFRILTSVLVVLLLLVATIFNVRLVTEHYNHWEDVAGGAFLSLVVVVFVLLVYLNKFRDTHYYENQKIQKRRLTSAESFKTYNNDIAMNHYKTETSGRAMMGGDTIQNGDTGGSISNNDLAMRYFQIPRANYRGAPRPLSSMRS